MRPHPVAPARSPEATEFARLRQILAYEERGGYRDRTVIGGLAPYARKLGERLRAAGAPAAALARAARVAAVLARYGELSPAARAEALAAARAALDAPLNGPSTTPLEQAPAPPVRPVRARRVEADFPAPDQPLTAIPGVGAQRARLLARLGLHTVGDLLRHFPLRHIEYPPPTRASELFFQPVGSFEGVVRRVDVQRTARGLQRTAVTLADATGEVEAVWLRAGYGLRFQPGQRLAVSGALTLLGRRLVFDNPDWEPADQGPLHTRGLVPVYPATKGLAQPWLRELVARAVDRWADAAADPLPAWLREAEGLPPRAAALRAIHFPTTREEAARARQRFAFDELLLMQLAIGLRRRAAEQVAGRALPTPVALLDAFRAALPFRLTAAQERVLAEIGHDLARSRPMTRLLQGEVGSGKTVIAAAAMLVAVAAGAQAALMAPTEILAEQHARTVRTLYERAADVLRAHLGRVPRVVLLTGRLSASERRQVRTAAATGHVDIVIGTQAVIQEGVAFRDLALAIADEQHRFGVRQRLALREKGACPHLLVMTATPIPRTLALTLYGDLDLSRLDELPPGRQPIRTVLLRPDERAHAYERLRREVAQGRQGYVICPLVEDSPHLEARAATEEYERLRHGALRGLRLGLLHGRLRSEEKEAVMAAFRDGALDVLVATAVVEVGVDVPNATMMIIEGAERFGLAQLHQFRGRVGRGEHPAICALIAQTTAAEALERLQIVAETSDGLALAEADLRLRGPGDYYGLRQSGLPTLQVASLGDLELIERTRAAATRLLEADPALARPEHAALARAVRDYLTQVGDPS
ncbi:MAG TPA: ATP-dependent DNA helicase RecG [Chloroflexota bacterium]|nr:ATP-dependent DNA helicase RecG [Chloroflexota bacterium]